MNGGRRAARAQRAVDVVGAGLALVLVSPLLAGIAVAIRRDSPGPVMYRQTRVGREGAAFRIHKFRSMRAGDGGPSLSVTGDPRVTRVGQVLRRTKLDELPQLLDVLAGHMSLVGPRPELPEYVERWPAAARPIILSVRPGITDPASIALRNEADELAAAADAERYYLEHLLPRKAAMYVAYVTGRSVRGDLWILARTAAAVLRG